MTMPIFWFGFSSSYSGQPIYDPFISQFYNIMFTAMPIIWFATMDLEFSKKTLLKAEYYTIGINNLCFSKMIFARWIFYAMW